MGNCCHKGNPDYDGYDTITSDEFYDPYHQFRNNVRTDEDIVRRHGPKRLDPIN